MKIQIYKNRIREKEIYTEDGVDGVHGDLVLGGIANEALGVGESHIRRRSSVSLVVGDNFHAVVLPNSDARVGCAEIDSDRWSLSLAGHLGSCRRVNGERVRELGLQKLLGM